METTRLKHQLEAIMPSANPELAEEAVQLYADLQMIEAALRQLQKLQTATESLTNRWMRDGIARWAATIASESAAQ